MNAPKRVTLVTTPSSAHPGLEIRDLLDVLAPFRRHEFVAWIAARLAKFLANVAERVHADRFGGEAFQFHLFDELRPRNQFVHGDAERRRHLFDDPVRFRVYGSHIQRILATADAQEAGGLLESLRAEARHRRQLHT